MEKRKNYRIKSKSRFIIFIVISLLTLSYGVTTVLGFNNVNGEEQHKYVTVQVTAGETMWDIADQYKPEDMDTREAVYKIQLENNLESANLNAGDTIKVPVQ